MRIVLAMAAFAAMAGIVRAENAPAAAHGLDEHIAVKSLYDGQQFPTSGKSG